MTVPLGSIIIPAHDEESVIARSLELLNGVLTAGLVDVIVVCNGCRDRTAAVARRFTGVRVCELDQPSKTAALRAGDQIALPGPRIYLDADVELTGRAAVATLQALHDGALAARPPRRFDSTGAHRIVQKWYDIRAQLPSMSSTLWGAGCYALSGAGRARFGDFPDVTADDHFINSLFTPDEVLIVPTDPVVVHTPRTVSALIRIKRRVYRTQASRAVGSGTSPLTTEQREQMADLRELLREEPDRIADVAIYAGIIALARLRARFGPHPRWERDGSSRQR